MAQECSHGHHHHHLDKALVITAAFALVEVLGGLVSGSLALLADAGHMVSDVAALGLATAAARIADRPAHSRMTFGYGRARIIAAQINGVALWFLAGWIIWEAIGRLISPPEVTGEIVTVVAAVGLAVNLIVLKWLHGGEDINSRAAFWHVLGDALGSVAAMVAGIVIVTTGWMTIDPLLSFLVAGILAWGGWHLIRETTFELMAGVPEEIDMELLQEEMETLPEVLGVHHIHVWRLPDSHLAISAHIQCESLDEWDAILQKLHRILCEHGIEHATLQPEVECCPESNHTCHL